MENVRKQRDDKLATIEKKKELFSIRTKLLYYKAGYRNRKNANIHE